ncbi:serpin-ZX-like [Syzygium oleosum]|uniref:serpin-ZX-like n=1 Tax=Syzygium oleosum TaxID=219896 RepID=UPI0024BA5E9A|nr:serpin-ZX-like [Syzygium oleosum]
MDLRESIANQTDAALALSKQLLLTGAKDSNLVFSPLSIHMVLGLIAAGSAGPTQDQLLSFLKAKSTDHLHSLASQLLLVVLADDSAAGGPKLSFANGIWIDKSLPLRPSFQQVVDASYKAATNFADFKTKDLIKVGLKWSRLNINPLQSLQGLPNLMELYMVDAFTGQTMKFEANTFKKLKILSIEQFSELTMVAVQVNAMPALEKLTFSKCEKLNMLPLGINMLTRLQELLLCNMNREFINRLRKNSEDRNLVSHDRDMHSYTLGEDQLWVRQNLP